MTTPRFYGFGPIWPNCSESDFLLPRTLYRGPYGNTQGPIAEIVYRKVHQEFTCPQDGRHVTHEFPTHLAIDIPNLPKHIAPLIYADGVIVVSESFAEKLIRSDLTGFNVRETKVTVNGRSPPGLRLRFLQVVVPPFLWVPPFADDFDNMCPRCSFGPLVCKQCRYMFVSCPTCGERALLEKVDAENVNGPRKNRRIFGVPYEVGYALDISKWQGTDFSGYSTITQKALDFMVRENAYPFAYEEIRVHS